MAKRKPSDPRAVKPPLVHITAFAKGDIVRVLLSPVDLTRDDTWTDLSPDRAEKLVGELSDALAALRVKGR